MRNKIGANESCSCGSGLKYKRCCRNNKSIMAIPSEENHQAKWEAHADKILLDVEKSFEIKKIFFTLLEAINGLKWRGACHFASPVLCTLFQGIGLDAHVCTGIVVSDNGRFSHSWVEVDKKIYDATIWLQKKIEWNSAPVIANMRVDTGEETYFQYGVERLPFEPEDDDLFYKSFFWIMNSAVNAENAPHEMNVWDVLIRIVYRLKSLYGIEIDVSKLQEKLMDARLTHTKKYPADSQLSGCTSSLISDIICGVWESGVVDTKGNSVNLSFSEDGICRIEQGMEAKSTYWQFVNNTIILSQNDKFAEADIFAKLYDLSAHAGTFRLCLNSDKWGLIYKPMEYI